jgi:glycosyltransferase involved in cell wall biosynthesis
MSAQRPLHVAHVLAAGHFGGLESVVQMLSLGQADRGHRVDVVMLLDRPGDGGSLAGRLEAGGVAVHRLSHGSRALIAERAALRRLLAELSPDVVHTHGYRADIQAGASARSNRRPTISTLHGFTGGSLKVRLFERIQLAHLRRHDRCIAVSGSIASRLRRAGIEAARIRVLQNAYAPTTRRSTREQAQRELGLPIGPRAVIGWVGRFSPEKAPDVALEAMRHVAHTDATLCFVGDGRMCAELERFSGEHRLDERVFFAGAHEQASRLFAAFDVLVLSSHTEGTPIVLFEAMDAGVPIVATRVGGIPEMLDASGAWLVDRAAPIALARALDEVLSDPTAARQRTAVARRVLSERFSLPGWLDAHEMLYRELVA